MAKGGLPLSLDRSEKTCSAPYITKKCKFINKTFQMIHKINKKFIIRNDCVQETPKIRKFKKL